MRNSFGNPAFLALAAIAAFGGPQAALAQLAPSRSGSSTLSYLSQEESMAALLQFGRCYASKETAKALRLIATEPTSRSEMQTYIALFRKSDEECLNGISQLSADLPLVRGAIAEGFYKERMAMPPALMQPAPAPAQVRNLSGAARCYVASHRQEVTSLLTETKPGSRREFEAVSKLMPDFLKCVPGAAKFNFGATVIRFRLAEAFMRTSAAAAPLGVK